MTSPKDGNDERFDSYRILRRALMRAFTEDAAMIRLAQEQLERTDLSKSKRSRWERCLRLMKQQQQARILKENPGHVFAEPAPLPQTPKEP